MSVLCCGDCFKCELEDCCREDITLEEKSFSDLMDKEIKDERRKDQIRQIDDPKYRAIARYRLTPKGKKMLHKMNTNEKAHKRFKRYEKSEKGIERRKRFEQKPERIEYRKNYMKTYNKKYQAVVRDRKEQKRMEEASHFLDIILKDGGVSVCDGQRNRPREREKYERIVKVISERHLDVIVTLNIDTGYIMKKGDLNEYYKNQ